MTSVVQEDVPFGNETWQTGKYRKQWEKPWEHGGLVWFYSGLMGFYGIHPQQNYEK